MATLIDDDVLDETDVRQRGPTIHRLDHHGLNFGIAFQITEDVLDITGNEDRMGKSLGRDLQKRKLTLPLIHALTKSPPDTQRKLRKLLTAEEPDRNAVCQILSETDSVTFALRTARQYVETATGALDVLSPSDSRDALRRMAIQVSDREH